MTNTISAQQLGEQLRQAELELLRKKQNGEVLITRSLRQWFELADTQPECEELYFRFVGKGEVALIFGDTGIGKTLLGYHLGFRFAELGHKVLYYCLEMQENQVRKRYPTLLAPPNFIRSVFNPSYDGERFDFAPIMEAIEAQLEAMSDAHCVLLLDNLKALSLASLKDNEIAMQVMAALKRLSNRCKDQGRQLTIIVFAHVKKVLRWQPMELNHLSGAKEIQIYLDSIIGFAESALDPNWKYLKHLKSRNFIRYEEVMVLESTHQQENHTFSFVGWQEEKEHLSQRPEGETGMQDALRLFEQNYSYAQIGQRLGVSDKTAKRYVEKARESAMPDTPGMPNTPDTPRSPGIPDTPRSPDASDTQAAAGSVIVSLPAPYKEMLPSQPGTSSLRLSPESPETSEYPEYSECSEYPAYSDEQTYPNSEVVQLLPLLFPVPGQAVSLFDLQPWLAEYGLALTEFDRHAQLYFSSLGHTYAIEPESRQYLPF